MIYVLILTPNWHKLYFQDLDFFCSAEFPDPKEDPQLFELVRSLMVHGPCQEHMVDGAPCLKNGFCDKGFPKQFQKHSTFEKNFMPRYRRLKKEEGGHTAQVYCRRLGREVELDNRYVVPFNRYLLMKYKVQIIELHICRKLGNCYQEISCRDLAIFPGN